MSFAKVKGALEQIYKPLGREIAAFKHTVNKVDYIVVANIATTVSNFYWWPTSNAYLSKQQPSGMLEGGIRPNTLKNVPVEFYSNTLSQIIGYYAPDLKKQGGVTHRLSSPPMNFPKIDYDGYCMFRLLEAGKVKVVPYNKGYMAVSLMVMTVEGFIKYKAYIAELQVIINKICAHCASIKNDVEKIRASVDAFSNTFIKQRLLSLLDAQVALVDNYLANLGKETGIALIVKKSYVKINGIGVIPLAVWAIGGVVILAIGGGAFWYADRKRASEKEERLLAAAAKRIKELHEEQVQNILDPSRTPQQKKHIADLLEKRTGELTKEKDKILENSVDNKPGFLDGLGSIIKWGIVGLVLVKGLDYAKSRNNKKN